MVMRKEVSKLEKESLKVVVYNRVSSEDQAEKESHIHQQEKNREYIRGLPRLLARAGFQIEKQKPT